MFENMNKVYISAIDASDREGSSLKDHTKGLRKYIHKVYTRIHLYKSCYVFQFSFINR
jgi:hypothetical protein